MAPSHSDADPRSPTRVVRLRKVLVIDRDAFWGPALRLALEESGYYMNLVADPQEGCRRSMERAYDLVILSGSIGPAAVQAIVDMLARRVSPPAILVLARPGELRVAGYNSDVPCAVLRPPFAVEDVVDAARTLVGVPWTDHRKGA